MRVAGNRSATTVGTRAPSEIVATTTATSTTGGTKTAATSDHARTIITMCRVAKSNSRRSRLPVSVIGIPSHERPRGRQSPRGEGATSTAQRALETTSVRWADATRNSTTSKHGPTSRQQDATARHRRRGSTKSKPRQPASPNAGACAGPADPRARPKPDPGATRPEPAAHPNAATARTRAPACASAENPSDAD
jgi:hypothetical protein